MSLDAELRMWGWMAEKDGDSNGAPRKHARSAGWQRMYQAPNQREEGPTPMPPDEARFERINQAIIELSAVDMPAAMILRAKYRDELMVSERDAEAAKRKLEQMIR